ncbi:hypothetical protein ACFE04_013035 [Oxalis oulophora]
MYSRCCLFAQTEKCVTKKPCSSFIEFSCVYVRGLKVLLMNCFTNRFKNRGCIGCFKEKPNLRTSVDAPKKGLRTRGQKKVKRRFKGEDFWSSSAGEMENSADRRSISTISTSNPTVDSNGNSGSSSKPAEFVNHGLLLWNQTRQQWLSNKKSETQSQSREPTISCYATYASLLGTNKPFARPIHLPEMIDFLVDVWEQDGLYD